MANPLAPPPAAPPRAPSAPAHGPSSTDVNTLAARVRLTESRVDEMRKMVDFVEENMLSNHRKLVASIKSLQSEIDGLRRTIGVVEDRIVMVIKEIRLTAKKEDVEVLKKYLDLWNPVKFATVDKVEELVRSMQKD